MTPESAGWAYTSLRVVELPAGGEHWVATGEDELIVVPLSGAVRVSVGDDHFDLAGRTDVFAGPTDVAYVGRDAEVVLTSPDGGRFALCGARTAVALPARRSVRPRCRSSCAGRGSAAARCATSAPRTPSRRGRSSPAK